MLCNWCGGGDHFMRDCKDKPTNEYARRQLSSGFPVIHVLHELDLQIENLHHGSDEDEGGNRETRQENKEKYDLQVFEANEDLRAVNDDLATVPCDTNISDLLDSSIATYYIVSQNEPITGFPVGQVGLAPRRLSPS